MSSSAPKLGPKSWEMWELRKAGAMDCEVDLSVRVSDLLDVQQDPAIWSFFERQKWAVSDVEYDVLLPSMRLAARLLQAGIPYMTAFLPAAKLHDEFVAKQDASALQDPDGPPGDLTDEDYTAPQASEISHDAAQAVRKELEEIVKVVEWKVNYDVLKDHGWLGITRQITDDPLPWQALERDGDIIPSDENLQSRGETRRHLVVGIMGEYVTALKANRANDERHMRAAFLAAVTIAHEIAHVIWHQDFRSINYAHDGSEPWVGDDLESELGNAFINFVFSGHIPKPCEFKTEPGKKINLEAPFHWYPKLNTGERNLYSTLKSISMRYLEAVFSEDFWSTLGDPLDKLNTTFYTDARAQLNPKTHTDPNPATAISPEFEVRGDRPTWKHNWLKKERSPIQPGEVSKEEIDCLSNGGADERAKMAAYLAAKSVNERAQYLHYLSGITGMRQAEAGCDVESDEETPSMEDIDDGFVQEDVPAGEPTGQVCINPIQVTYKRKVTTVHQSVRGSKRPRADGDDSDDESNAAGSKRTRVETDENQADALLKRADIEDRFDDNDYDCRDIDEILQNKNFWAIGRLTRIQAYNYCIKRGIRIDALDGAEKMQNMMLNERRFEKHALIERIRRYALDQAEKLFKDDKYALVKFKRARTFGVSHWDSVDLGTLIAKIDPTVKTTDAAEKKINEYFETELRVAIADYEKETGLKVAEDKSAQAQAELEFNDWDTDSFQAYFRMNNLPMWGTRRAWEIRIERFKQWGRNEIPKKVRLKLINQTSKGKLQERATRGGKEGYCFRANRFHCCSVASLKTKLFEVGHFSANAELDIYMGGDRRYAWEDERALDYYFGFKFADLQLVVREFKGHRASTGISSTGISNDPAKIPDEDEPVVYKPMGSVPAKPAESSAQAAAASGSRASPSKEAPTLGQLLRETVNQGAHEVIEATEPSGATASATEILDNLEDIAEVRAGPSASVNSNDQETGEERRERKGKGKSHMADLYDKTEGS